MEKIQFDEKTFIYKTKLDLSEFKDVLLTECNKIISSDPNNNTGAYDIVASTDKSGRIMSLNNCIKDVIQFGIDNCIKLNEELYDKVLHSCWVNVLQAQNIVQKYGHGEAMTKYHTHTEISRHQNRFIPKFTYVYYVQMPDKLFDNDGVLNVMGQHEKEYFILPEEGDLIILNGDTPHGPQPAHNSSLDRIVIAGNVGFIKPFKYSFG